MAVSAEEILKGQYNRSCTMGDKAINSDAAFEI